MGREKEIVERLERIEKLLGRVASGRFATRGVVFDSVDAAFYLEDGDFNLRDLRLSHETGTLDGQVAAFVVMVVAAAEVVIGLAIIVTIFRTRRSASVDDANLLKF